jgi:thiaminase
MGREFDSPTVLPSAALAACAWDEIHELRASLATDLKTRAEHYRRLADMVFDENVVAAVRDCACELEREASAIEDRELNSFRLRYQRAAKLELRSPKPFE